MPQRRQIRPAGKPRPSPCQERKDRKSPYDSLDIATSPAFPGDCGTFVLRSSGSPMESVEPSNPFAYACGTTDLKDALRPSASKETQANAGKPKARELKKSGQPIAHRTTALNPIHDKNKEIRWKCFRDGRQHITRPNTPTSHRAKLPKSSPWAGRPDRCTAGY